MKTFEQWMEAFNPRGNEAGLRKDIERLGQLLKSQGVRVSIFYKNLGTDSIFITQRCEVSIHGDRRSALLGSILEKVIKLLEKWDYRVIDDGIERMDYVYRVIGISNKEQPRRINIYKIQNSRKYRNRVGAEVIEKARTTEWRFVDWENKYYDLLGKLPPDGYNMLSDMRKHLGSKRFYDHARVFSDYLRDQGHDQAADDLLRTFDMRGNS